MTTTTMAPKNLDELVLEHDLIVLTHDGGELGRYYPHAGLITLRSDLGPLNRRWILAHEIGHHVLGHQPDAQGWFHSRQENRADEWAALQLITCNDYVAAEELHGPHFPAIAAELGVTQAALATWRDLHERKTA